MPLESSRPFLLRRLLAVLLAVAMIWQGIEAARSTFPDRTDVPVGVVMAATPDQASDPDMTGDLRGDSDCGDHMQHHATAALDTPPAVSLARPAADRIERDRGLQPSADNNTPLRPPRTTPIACI